MKLYKTKLEPQSDFATTLRGDTLFGQICWSISYLFGKERIAELLAEYEDRPFLVVSDAFAPGYLPKPSLPSTLLGEESTEKKSNRKRVWMSVKALSNGQYTQSKTDGEVNDSIVKMTTVHNSLDYRTFNTGGDAFAPYSVVEYRLSPKEIYFLLDESRLSRSELDEILSFVGSHGYGKESSIGKGRFEVTKLEEAVLPNAGKRFMALGPSVLEGGNFTECWYDTFVRFGKHGGKRAFANAFKRPLLMADKGAVVEFDRPDKVQYIGKAVRGVSPAYPDTVHQGYAIVIAIGEVA